MENISKDKIETGYLANPKIPYGFRLDRPKIYGYLNHDATKTTLTCYQSIGWFKRLMLKLCFGLRFEKIK